MSTSVEHAGLAGRSERSKNRHSQGKKTKVALVMEATIGGTREHLMQIARRLHLSRFDLTVICSSLRDPSFMKDVEKMRRWGVRVFLLPMQRDIQPASDFFSFFWLCRHFNLENYDVVHTHCSKAGMLGRLAASTAGVSHVFHTPHTFPFESPRCPSLKARFYRFLEQIGGLYTEKLILLTEAQRSFAVGNGIVNNSRTSVIRNGLAARTRDEILATALTRADVGLKDDQLVVGCVGRLAPQKGHEYLLQAAERICKEREKAVFVLVGDGERRRELENEVETKGLRGKVLFLGQRNDVRDLYPCFDVLAMSSLYEGLPYVILEAMEALCPVVSFRFQGLDELIIDGQTGLTAAPGNSDELAAGILRLLDDAALRKEVAENARKLVEDSFSAERFIGEIEALYEGK